ncbi:MAG TPA: hypothetical protein VGK78_15835 [Nocardioides sp.]|uniref:hypothetical protein n=1 Tax=Nocardioides sp. TaxID=35761 RepID=UPI002F4114A6
MITKRRPRLRHLLTAMVAGLLLVLASPTTASAMHGDRVPKAKSRILGSHLTNHRTHVETWIVGYYPYRRLVRVHHRWRAKTFYGLRISAQHCDDRHCWGRVVEGKLWSPHQPGRRVPGSRMVTSATPPRNDFCISGTTSCAAPWNWVTRFIDTRQRRLVQLYVDPCAKGSLAGAGVIASKDLSARILLEGGVITAAKAATIFEGPAGMALGALAGCMAGEGSGGWRTVRALVSHLNPFDREIAPRG